MERGESGGMGSFEVSIKPDLEKQEQAKVKCEKALSKMKTNKAPGLDGMTTEFYKALWPLLDNLIEHMFNESYELGELSESQRKAVISLIFKKDDQEDTSNYRPISPTNVDYRILAFTLAERVQQVMGDLVSTDQSAYIRGRYMGTNIRLVNDILEYYDLFSKSGILLTLDFTKAFDTLQWDFMFKSLQFFNFGPSFIQWSTEKHCLINQKHALKIMATSLIISIFKEA